MNVMSLKRMQWRMRLSLETPRSRVVCSLDVTRKSSSRDWARSLCRVNLKTCLRPRDCSSLHRIWTLGRSMVTLVLLTCRPSLRGKMHPSKLWSNLRIRKPMKCSWGLVPLRLRCSCASWAHLSIWTINRHRWQQAVKCLTAIWQHRCTIIARQFAVKSLTLSRVYFIRCSMIRNQA